MFTTTMGQQENRLPVNENNYDGMAGLEDDDNEDKGLRRTDTQAIGWARAKSHNRETHHQVRVTSTPFAFKRGVFLDNWAGPQLGLGGERALEVRPSRCKEQPQIDGKGNRTSGVAYK